MTFTIKKAAPIDFKQVIKLLQHADLPTQDLSLEHLETFLISVSNEGLVVGACGLELCGADALLRSLVVDKLYRRQGLARALVSEIEQTARNHGVTSLYLLTDTAADFFKTKGFTECDRTTVPQVVGETREFSTLCSASAVCLEKKVPA